MVAREFQSYTFKQSVDFLNAVDVVDAAEQPRRGIRWSDAGKKFIAVENLASLFSGSCPRCRRRLGGEWRRRKSAAAEDLAMPLRETVVQDAAAAWKEGNKMQQPRRLEGGEQGVPERPNPLWRRSSLRYSERLRKNRSIRGFRFLSFLIYVFVRRVLFPHWFFFLSSALPGI